MNFLYHMLMFLSERVSPGNKDVAVPAYDRRRGWNATAVLVPFS